MSKSSVTRLFVGAVLAVVVGVLVAFAAIVAALAGGVVTIGGPAVVTVNGGAFAGTLVWLIIASLAITGSRWPPTSSPARTPRGRTRHTLPARRRPAPESS